MTVQVINTDFAKTLWSATKTGWQQARTAATHLEYSILDPKYIESLEKNFKVKDQNLSTSFTNALNETRVVSTETNWLKRTLKNNVFKRIWKNLDLKNIKSEYNVVKSELASATEKLGTLKTMGKYLGPVGKRMPLIANLIFVATEIPNIYRSFTDTANGGGLLTGLKEIGKASVKTAGFGIGAAIGTVLLPIPVVGSLIGGAIGGWIAGFVTGKTFTEKKEEAELETAQGDKDKTNVQDEDKESKQVADNTNQNAATGSSSNPFTFDPTASAQMNQADWVDKDFMAMNTGLA